MALDNGNGVKIFVHILWLSAFVAQAAVAEITVTRTVGNSMNLTTPEADYATGSVKRVDVLNKHTTLTMKWVTIHDDSMPADIAGTASASITGNKSHLGYSVGYTIQAKQDIVACQVILLLFDIWGNHVRTLSDTEVRDVKAQAKYNGGGTWLWSLLSESEASQHYASIAYINRVRTKDGQIFNADINAVLSEARKFSDKLQESDLISED